MAESKQLELRRVTGAGDIKQTNAVSHKPHEQNDTYYTLCVGSLRVMCNLSVGRGMNLILMMGLAVINDKRKC